jgi:hypothetical protein
MKYIVPTLLTAAITFQVILAFLAEYSGEYPAAIYELMWAGVFYYFLNEEMNDG